MIGACGWYGLVKTACCCAIVVGWTFGPEIGLGPPWGGFGKFSAGPEIGLFSPGGGAGGRLSGGPEIGGGGGGGGGVDSSIEAIDDAG